MAAVATTLQIDLRDVVAAALDVSRKKLGRPYADPPRMLGRLAEMAKKEAFHGRPAKREAWVLALADVAGWLMLVDGEDNLPQIWSENLDKLRARYPDGFVVGGAKVPPTVL